MFVLGIKAHYLVMIDDVFTKNQALDGCFAIYVGVVCCHFVISHVFEWLNCSRKFCNLFLKLKKKVLHLTLCIHVSCTLYIFVISIFQVHHIHLPLPCVFFISSKNLSQYQIK